LDNLQNFNFARLDKLKELCFTEAYYRDDDHRSSKGHTMNMMSIIVLQQNSHIFIKPNTRQALCLGFKILLCFSFLTISGLSLPNQSPAQGVSVISPKTERALGKQQDAILIKKMGYYRDPFLQKYIEKIGKKIASMVNRKAYTFHFKVVDDHRENAMALPGGYIYITRGMLAALNSEAEMAGVLGHEIAHVTQRHGARQMTKALGAQILSIVAAGAGAIAGGGSIGPAITVAQAISANILNGHGRTFELEADAKGLYYAWKAGYDPREAAKFMRRLRQLERLRGIGYHGFGATHPGSTLRILKLDEISQALVRTPSKLKVYTNRYKSHLSGLIYGRRKDGMLLRIYTAKKGETLHEISERFLGNKDFALELALLNDLDENALLKSGQRVKIVLKK
jgi:predicted Zn-dependent protease